MILNEIKPHAETFGTLDEKFFGIADQGMIFNILRSKLYSNPILAVCREISCNALDAHREVGKFEEPIIIQLPTGLESNYKIKDFGPGISPDRIENVFIQYAASTKRGDNVQIGAMGLGCKSPFAVSDSFSVTTIHNNTKYHYVCFIDETKIGKIALLSKEKTNETNGTEISIPVKSIDFNSFRQHTEQACRHWDVKPIITGAELEWQTFSKIIEGKDWAIAVNNHSYGYEHLPKLVIGGIEYPLDIEALRKYADTKLIDVCRGTMIMYFGVGELSLSANREQIYLDKPTQEKIKNRLTDITLEMKKLVEIKIDSFANLWDANVYYRKELSQAFSSLSFLGKLSWKNYPLNNGSVNIDCPVFSFTHKTFHSYRRRRFCKNTKDPDPNKLYKYISKNIGFSENSCVYINDLSIKDLTPRHVKKAFKDDPTLTCVQVICPNDKQSEADLNKKINLDQMAPKKLSTITKGPSRAYVPSAQRLLIFKFDTEACAFRQVSYASMEEDANNKILCLLSRTASFDNRVPITANGNFIATNALKSLSNLNTNTSFYGIDKDTDKARVVEEFSKFKTLDKFIDQKVLNNKLVNYVEIKYAQLHKYKIDSYLLDHFDKYEALISDKKSIFIKRLIACKKIKKMSENNKELLDIYELVNGVISDIEMNNFVKNNPDWDLDAFNKACDQKYPLLEMISSYDYMRIINHIAHYVNLVDKN